jgi:hypothetical protein
MKLAVLGLVVSAALAALAVVGYRATSVEVPGAPALSAAPVAAVTVPAPAISPAAPVVPAEPVKPAAPVALAVPEPVEVPVAAEPEQPKGEPLPEFPMINPKNKQVPLHPDKKSIIAEVADGKVLRVGIVAEVCLRQGPLEQFLCKKGTKEHEAIVRVDMDAEMVHLAIIAAGGKPGTPTGFIDPKTEEAKHTPATGSKVIVNVHYRKDGKLFTHPAQEWIWDTKKKAPIPFTWVFAGSHFIKDPTNPNAKPYYGANSGDIFSISNFPYSTLEFPVPISKDEAQLTYEAKTDKIPPLTSKVWLLIEVPAEKK